MKIYTKKGDSGETGLYGGARVSKDHLRIQAYGTLDELNAVLGWVLAVPGLADPLRERILRIQGELFQTGAELATPAGKTVRSALVGAPEVERLEQEIDSMESELAPLSTFILPGGGEAAARLHVARTVSRRAERELVTLSRQEAIRPEVMGYLNRLSDYLFVSARYANRREGYADVPWIAPSN